MWDQRYSQPGFAYGTEPNAFIAAHAARIPAGPVLCLAEGEGRNAAFLAGLGHPVTAVDASRVGMAKAAELAAARGVTVETIVADLAHFDLGAARWAGIVASFFHAPEPVRRRVHRAIPRALRPGGVLLLEAYAPAQLGRGTGGPPRAELLIPLDELREDLAGLHLVHAVETEREVNEGRYHTGPGSVVQVVGIRPPGDGAPATP